MKLKKAGKKVSNAFHMDIRTNTKSPYALIRQSYREDGKVKKRTLSCIKGVPLEQLQLMRAALLGEIVLKEDFNITSSREYGGSFVCVEMIKALGLDKAIYSRTSEEWVRASIAMIAGRLVNVGSKLFLSHCGSYSSLWNVCGIDGDIDVNVHCYEAMDRLLSRQDAIQQALAKKHLTEGIIIFYDITSCYMEGEYKNSKLVRFGYNRDNKRGHPQIVVGLLCTKYGCPFGAEVFEGNMKDEKTVMNKLKEIKEKYGITKFAFVGDRGMVTQANYEKIDHDTIKVISALSHGRIKTLLEKGTIQIGMFDKDNIVEVIDGSIRYCLCKNPKTAEKETATREKLLKKTTEKLDEIIASKRKTKYSKEVRAGKVVNKYKMG